MEFEKTEQKIQILGKRAINFPVSKKKYSKFSYFEKSCQKLRILKKK
jgi:hypothetical protein